MRFTCNRIYKLARGKISLRSLLLLFFQAHLLTVVGVDCDCEPTPQMRDFMDWKLEKDGDHERLEEHRFSMALKVVNDLAIFSSSKVIRAFWKSQKRDSAIKIHSVASCFQSRTFFLVLPRNTTLILAKKRHKTSSKKGGPIKCPVSKFVYSFSQLIWHQIFKILVSTPYNTPVIMGGRHKQISDKPICE